MVNLFLWELDEFWIQMEYWKNLSIQHCFAHRINTSFPAEYPIYSEHVFRLRMKELTLNFPSVYLATDYGIFGELKLVQVEF